MQQQHWILVANASKARLFERSAFNQPLTELADWTHPESRLSARETERAPLGHSLAGRAGLSPRSDIHQRHRSQFAQTLSHYLQEAVLNQRVKALTLVVSNPFLGELLVHLDAPVQKILKAHHGLDWTSLSITDVDQRLRSEFLL